MSCLKTILSVGLCRVFILYYKGVCILLLSVRVLSTMARNPNPF